MYRVLLADDEQIERMALARRLMRRFGDSLQISEATDGKEAVELYQKEHSQIIIMDISMPELNGVEAAEQIRSMDEDCVIVFLTAYDEFSYAKRAIVIRALDYLLKPCDEEELAAVMEEAMRLTDKAVHNKENPTGNGAGMTEAEKEAEKRREQMAMESGCRGAKGSGDRADESGGREDTDLYPGKLYERDLHAGRCKTV